MATYIAIAAGLLAYSLVVLTLYTQGQEYDKVHQRLEKVAGEDKSKLIPDEELSKPLFERFVKPMTKALADRVVRNSPQKGGQGGKKQMDQLKKMVYQAGLGIGPYEYQALRLIIILGTGVFMLFLGLALRMAPLLLLYMGIFGVFFAFVLLRFHLASRVSKRRKFMERQLPEVLDLLSVSVEAGLGFEQAIFHVISQFEGPLIDELTITYREMSMGRTRRDALLLFAERCDLEEIRSFVGAIVQAGELGISIKNVLRAQAAAMRQSHRAKIEEKAHKIAIKILLPMVAFIFPVLFIVLMGPAVVRILEMFG